MHTPPTLATCLEPFLADLGHLERLRPQTPRAYRYNLAAAAADPRFQQPLSDMDYKDLNAWLVRGKAATSTVGRRSAAACARRVPWPNWRHCAAGAPCRDRSASSRNSAHWMRPSRAHRHPTA
jgi:hypothetical protein